MSTHQRTAESAAIKDSALATSDDAPARLRAVGVREFRDHASEYLAGRDIVAIERRGRTIGYYIPIAASPGDEARQALALINRTLAEVVASGAITEEELERVFDLSRPWPEPDEAPTPSAS